MRQAWFCGLLLWAAMVPGQSAMAGTSDKAMPLGSDATLTLNAEARLRADAFDNAQLARGNDYGQGLFRGIFGADLRLSPAIRVHGEMATGQVAGRRASASANFQNDATVQQLFVDARGHAGSILLGVMAGRQEFADGPRQLISPGDGPNIHRSWNGVRLYAQGRSFRLGAFDLRATRPGRGVFDDGIRGGERLQGITASLSILSGDKTATTLDPFWIHSENPGFRSGGHAGLDARDSLGLRLRRRAGALELDWTLAYQTGRFMDRDAEAWGFFAVQSLALSGAGWKPRLTGRVDVASGGGAYGGGTLRSFNPLYASSNYLGEGRFLSLSNLLMVTPGLAVSPTSSTTLSVDYGFARRLVGGDAAYAGGMRPYAGTQAMPGHDIGRLLRLSGTWAVSDHLTLFANWEQFAAGDLLRRAGVSSGRYGQIGATLRY